MIVFRCTQRVSASAIPCWNFEQPDLPLLTLAFSVRTGIRTWSTSARPRHVL